MSGKDRCSFSDLSSLSNDLKNLVNNKKYSDVTFVVEGLKIFGHRLVLSVRSEVFHAMLFGSMSESSQNEIIIKDPNVTSSSFLSLLQFIYCGSVDITTSNVIHLLHLSNFYNIPILSSQCHQFIKEILSVDTVLTMLNAAVTMADKAMIDSCNEFLSQINILQTIQQSKVEDLSKELVIYLLTLKVLDVEEIELFKFVYKWIEHHKPCQEIVTEVLSHIRFPLISSVDLTSVVIPTKIVPMETCYEALQFQAVPSLFPSSKTRFTARVRPPPVDLQWDPSFSKKGSVIQGNTIPIQDFNGVFMVKQCLDVSRDNYWEVEVVTKPTQHCFGVAQHGTDLEGWANFGFDKYGWGWGHGFKYYSHNSSTPGESPQTHKIEAKTTVGVLFKKDRTLRFYVNKIFVGQHPIKVEGDVYPAVALYGKGSLKIGRLTRKVPK